MALYSSGTLLANVELIDTFNTWRVRTNQIIADAASTTGNNTFTGTQTYSANLIPSANVTYDLGSATMAWKDLYLSGNTIYLGGATITSTGNTVDISVGGTSVISGSATPGVPTQLSTVTSNTITVTGSFTAANANFSGPITAASITANSFIGDGSQLTNAGSTVATGTNNADLNVPFTGITSGTMTSANVDVNFTYNPATGTLTANNFVGDGSGLTNAGATVAAKSDNVDYKVTFTNQLNGAHANTFVNTSFTFNPSTGDASATNFNSTSDAVWKKEITPIENASQIISKLSGKAFNWVHTGKKSYGVIAQEVESVLPDVVVENTAGKAVNYNTLIAFLIESNKELQQRIQNLENNK